MVLLYLPRHHRCISPPLRPTRASWAPTSTSLSYMLMASPTPPLKVVELVVRRQLAVQHHDGDDIPFVAGEVSSTLHVERRHQPSQQSPRKRAHQVFRYWRLQRLRLFRRIALELKTVSYCARCAVEDDRRLKEKLTCETHMSASGKSSSRGILGHTEGAYAYDATWYSGTRQ